MTSIYSIIPHYEVSCVPIVGPSGHKTGVISDSRPGPLLINDDAIVPQGTSVEVIFLHLQHEASTRYYGKRILREAHITRSARKNI